LYEFKATREGALDEPLVLEASSPVFGVVGKLDVSVPPNGRDYIMPHLLTLTFTAERVRGLVHPALPIAAREALAALTGVALLDVLHGR
jgi:hypothetical protein